MNLSDIEAKINNVFENSKQRQIIFWYDGNKDFQNEIQYMQLNNAELFILEEDNWIYAKYYIEFENKEKNFLIYAPFTRPNDETNYLADMLHYSYLFTADKISLIAQDLGIPKECLPVLEEYPKFWNANSRINSFKNLQIDNFNELSITLGIMAVLTNQSINRIPYILRAVIAEDINETNKYVEEFKKYGILEQFWEIVSIELKYSSSNPNVEDLISFLLINYTAFFMDEYIPKTWNNYLIQNKNNIRIFIGEFMESNDYSLIYDELANAYESKVLFSSLSNMDINSYKNCDTFEIFDKNIISHYADILFTNQVALGSDFEELLESREKTHFYKKYENSYLLLKYANNFINLINEFERIGVSEDIEDIINSYANKWSYIDGYYRKFYYHYDKIDNIDDFNDLRQLIENMYVNSFLNVINPKFSNKLQELSLNEINVPKQWKFYKNNIPNSVSQHKTAVIISDGFRYGCAIELLDELNKNPTRKTTLEPMLSTIPSYTALGMASLLPNKDISYDNATVLVDEKKCAKTEERDKILKSYNPNAKAIRFEDLIGLNKPDMREKLKDVNLVYVYHDNIDNTGHHGDEHKVFNAAQESIDEIIKLIKKLRDNVNFVSFFITADHGFIYKRDKLTESSKVEIKTINDLSKTRRYLLTDEKTDILGTISFPLDYLNIDDMYVTVPKGTDVLKTRGSSMNFVHGGASLQECIIPILNVKDAKGGRNQRPVEIQLISTNNKITNYEIMLTFFQKENVSQTVTPVKAAVYFVDEHFEKISNEEIIDANKDSNSSEDREFKILFTLLKRTYDKSKEYKLIIQDVKTGKLISEEKFIIDIAFQDGFSFDI